MTIPACSLHQGAASGRSDEFEAALLDCLAHGLAFALLLDRESPGSTEPAPDLPPIPAGIIPGSSQNQNYAH